MSLESFENLKVLDKTYDCEACGNEGHIFCCCVCGRTKELKDMPVKK